MFPEDTPTEKQDIFALGIILLELLTHRKEIKFVAQVEDSSDRKLIVKMLTGEFDNLEEIWNTIVPQAKQNAGKTPIEKEDTSPFWAIVFGVVGVIALALK